MAQQFQQIDPLETPLRHRCSCKQITFFFRLKQIMTEKKLLLEKSLRNIFFVFCATSSGLHTTKQTLENYPA